MFLTQPVSDLLDCFVGIPVVVEFVGAVQSGTVKLDVTMNMVLIYMSSYNELVLAAGKFQGKLIPQPVCFLRCNFSWPKRLNQQIGNNIFVWIAPPPGSGFINLLTDGKFLPRGICAALIGGHQQAALCFLRIFVVVQSIFQYRRDTAALTCIVVVKHFCDTLFEKFTWHI